MLKLILTDLAYLGLLFLPLVVLWFLSDVQRFAKITNCLRKGVQVHRKTCLRNYLLKRYKEDYLKLPFLPTNFTKIMDVEKMFVPVLAERTISNTNKPTKNGSKNILECITDIFDSTRKQGQNVFITGSAGMGKTVFCRKLISAWCTGQPQNSSGSYFPHSESAFRKTVSQFDLVFYVWLSNIDPNMTIENVIEKQLLKGKHLDVFYEYVKTNPGKCLYIVDGVDDYIETCDNTTYEKVCRMQRLPKRKYSCTTIYTIGQWSMGKIPEDEVGEEIKLVGLNRNLARLLSQSLKEEMVKVGQPDRTEEELDQIITYEAVEYCPMLLTVKFCAWYISGRFYTSITDAFCTLVDWNLKHVSDTNGHGPLRTKGHTGKLFSNKRCRDNAGLLHKLGKFSFHRVSERSVMNLESIGLSAKDYPALRNMGIPLPAEEESKAVFSSMNKSFVDFFAALHVSEEPLKMHELFPKHLDANGNINFGAMYLTLLFICGFESSLVKKVTLYIYQDTFLPRKNARVLKRVLSQEQSIVFRCIQEADNNMTNAKPDLPLKYVRIKHKDDVSKYGYLDPRSIVTMTIQPEDTCDDDEISKKVQENEGFVIIRIDNIILKTFSQTSKLTDVSIHGRTLYHSTVSKMLTAVQTLQRVRFDSVVCLEDLECGCSEIDLVTGCAMNTPPRFPVTFLRQLSIVNSTDVTIHVSSLQSLKSLEVEHREFTEIQKYIRFIETAERLEELRLVVRGSDENQSSLKRGTFQSSSSLSIWPFSTPTVANEESLIPRHEDVRGCLLTAEECVTKTGEARAIEDDLTGTSFKKFVFEATDFYVYNYTCENVDILCSEFLSAMKCCKVENTSVINLCKLSLHKQPVVIGVGTAVDHIQELQSTKVAPYLDRNQLCNDKLNHQVPIIIVALDTDIKKVQKLLCIYKNDEVKPLVALIRQVEPFEEADMPLCSFGSAHYCVTTPVKLKTDIEDLLERFAFDVVIEVSKILQCLSQSYTCLMKTGSNPKRLPFSEISAYVSRLRNYGVYICTNEEHLSSHDVVTHLDHLGSQERQIELSKLFSRIKCIYARSNIPAVERPDIVIKEPKRPTKEVLRGLLCVDGVLGYGFRFDILHVFVDDKLSERNKEITKSKIQSVLWENDKYDFIICHSTSKLSRYCKMTPGSSLEAEKGGFGTVGGFVWKQTSKTVPEEDDKLLSPNTSETVPSEILCVVTSRHVLQMSDSKTFYIGNIEAKILQSACKCSDFDCEDHELDIAVLQISKDYADISDHIEIRFKDEKGQPMECILFDPKKHDVKDISDVVYFYGHSTKMGKGQIDMETYETEKSCSRIVFKNYETPSSDKIQVFCKGGDSGAPICVRDRNGKLYVLAMLMGELFGQQRYQGFYMKSGLEQLDKSHAGVFTLCGKKLDDSS